MEPNKIPTFIPVASGKGGVGKTFLTANLAIALAQMGQKVIAVDLDLGGSNLHTYLGLGNNSPGIGDFLHRGGGLEELLVPTSWEHLRFLPGDGRTPFLANLPHAQKQKLLLNLTRLQADYVLLDLGAGSSYNTLDYFGMSPNGLIITVPEYATLMNMMTFLKNFAFRTVERALPPKSFLRQQVQRMLQNQDPEKPLTMDELMEVISKDSPELGEGVGKRWLGYRPRIVFNRGQGPEDLGTLEQIQTSLEQSLKLRVDFFGFVFADGLASELTRQRQTLMGSAPDSTLADDVNRLADRILRLWEQPIRNSAPLLRNNTEAIIQERQAAE